MALPWINELHAENWARLTSEKRLSALNVMEKSLARQERRVPCEVKWIPENERVIRSNGEPALRGQYDPNRKEIQIDPILLSGDHPPYQATETYFHEARHAYQHYAIEHPEMHNVPEQVADWEKNHGGGYVDRSDISKGLAKYSHYRWQPVEADAKQVALERNVELHSGMFHDTTPDYQKYRVEKELEISKDRNQAVNEIGTTEYEEEARFFMLAKHDAELGMQQLGLSSEARTAYETHDTSELEQNEEEKFHYGYGI